MVKALKENGPLSFNEKEYIAISQRCEPCINLHGEAMMKTGPKRKELGDVLAMSIQIGGSPGLMYAAHALACRDELAAPAMAAELPPLSHPKRRSAGVCAAAGQALCCPRGALDGRFSMLAGRSWDDLIAEYAESHQNRWNQLLHIFGIPMIVVSVAMFGLAPFMAGLWAPAALLLASSGVMLFIGHAIEGKSPDVRREWRFLLVGLRWWVATVTGRLP